MAAGVVRTVGKQRDQEGILCTRKALVRCGIDLNYNGMWEECQLSSELQNIVKKYAKNITDSKADAYGSNHTDTRSGKKIVET